MKLRIAKKILVNDGLPKEGGMRLFGLHFHDSRYRINTLQAAYWRFLKTKPNLELVGLWTYGKWKERLNERRNPTK